MVETTLYVGLDTDKSFVDIGLAEPLPDGEVRYWGKLGNEPASMDRLVKRLQRNGRKLVESAKRAVVEALTGGVRTGRRGRLLRRR